MTHKGGNLGTCGEYDNCCEKVCVKLMGEKVGERLNHRS